MASAKIAVVGGGITGLATAWWLSRQSANAPDITVYQADDTCGGALQTGELAGLPVEQGAEMIRKTPLVETMAWELGLGQQCRIPATTSASIWSHNKFFPFPPGSYFGIPTDVTDLQHYGFLSPSSLAMLESEPERPGLVLPADHDVSVADYLVPRLSEELVHTLIEPILGGIYAGSVDRLSFRATMPNLAAHLEDQPSVIVAAARAAGESARAAGGSAFVSFPQGLSQWIKALQLTMSVDLRVSNPVKSVSPGRDGMWNVTSQLSGTEVFDAVIMAIPAYRAADCLDPVLGVSQQLRQIPTASVALVAAILDLPDITEHIPGSGVLTASLPLSVKAITAVSNKWEHLRPARGSIIRASVGRFGEADHLNLSDDQLLRLVLDEVAHIAPGLSTACINPLETQVHRWPHCLPQYQVGHDQLVNGIRKQLEHYPAIRIAGASYDGVGIAACLASAHQSALQTLDYLATDNGG